MSTTSPPPKGSTRALTDSSASVTDTYDFDAWGNAVASTGSSTNPYRFAGELWLSGPAFTYLRHRFYDPARGRFLTEDPIRDGRNWYAYCGNNPVNWVDPWGL